MLDTGSIDHGGEKRSGPWLVIVPNVEGRQGVAFKLWSTDCAPKDLGVTRNKGLMEMSPNTTHTSPIERSMVVTIDHSLCVYTN